MQRRLFAEVGTGEKTLLSGSELIIPMRRKAPHG
jgi:hypothetical protein